MVKGERGNCNNRNQPSGFKLSSIFFTLTSFFLIILIMPLVLAVDVSMNSEFSKGETLVAVFSGNFVDQITEDNVFFRRDTGSPVPFDYEVIKIEDDFYVSATLGNTPGNYSLIIDGVRYYQTTQIVDDEIVSNFTILDSSAPFSISPRVLKVTDDFSINIQNLFDSKIRVDIETDSDTTNAISYVDLNTGQSKAVYFTLANNAPRGLTEINFFSENFSYSLPVYIDTNLSEPEEQNFDMEFQPRTAEISLATDSQTKRILYLKNTGSEILEDVYFTISPVLEKYITISPETINSISPGESEKIEITIISDLEEAVVEGKITSHSENTSSQITLTIEFIQDFIPADGETDEPISLASCEELEGTICADNLECTGETERAKDGVCCLKPATCEEPKKSSTGKYIGWLLIILVFIGVIWFFKKKYKKVARRRPF